MRNVMFGAAAALAACAVPGMASAQGDYVGLSYSRATVDTNTTSSVDLDNVGVDGRAAFDLGGLGAQVGARYVNVSPDQSGAKDSNAYSIDGHLYVRHDDVQWGGALQYSNIDASGAGNSEEWAAAFETLMFQGRNTWGLSVNYSDASDAGLTAIGVSGEGRHFYTDNFEVFAGLGVNSVQSSGSKSSSLWNAGVGAEYQLSALPISIYGGYQHNDFSDTPHNTADADSLYIGARWNFGGTLLERDRSGANLHALHGAAASLLGL